MLYEVWACWAGPSESVIIDLERGFGTEFLALLNQYTVEVIPVAGT